MPQHDISNPMVEYWQSGDKPCSLPEGQGDVKRKWKAAVMIEDATCRVHEYELNPGQKLRLSDMLSAITLALNELSDETTQDCGFKIW